VRLVAAVAVLIVFGWAVLVAAEGRYEALPAEVVHVAVVYEQPLAPSAWEVALAVETPLADALVDWDAVERESDCLFEFLRQHFGWEITLERVLAAGAWTDELGGACAVIGEDDE